MKEYEGGREMACVRPRTRRDNVTCSGHVSRCHGGEVMGRRLGGVGWPWHSGLAVWCGPGHFVSSCLEGSPGLSASL